MSRVTISDIAEKLGISTAAVSYALNDRPGVSGATRQRVLDLADEMGWQPHSIARSLRSNRAMSVGMVLARDAEEVANEPFYSYVQAGVERHLAAHDYSLTMSRPGGAPGDDLEVYRRWALQQRVDGVILFDMVVDDPRVELLAELNLPAVEVTSDATVGPLPRVVVDDSGDARILVHHLADQGYRSIVHLSGPTHLVHETLRRTAVARACQEFWGEVLFASVMTTDANRTLAVGLRLYSTQTNVYWNEIMAASLVVSAPIVIAFLLLQRSFVAGLTAGAVK
ncbi:LacI family DNA-binding transcriptional regulator [Acidipropionibacterium jensenii]|uniref:LacI family DNA-binding transcriptional regulator n=1 Tax=Acidipropionibacterium jensenii TaxID=1749 RepID=UPI00110BE609|nr:LacI family DNA-binding transcriptional regulator [Acidipropionibacterium jensenii]QCV87942.1 LacI family DNA-binding transcriptional regulator [Acidipropionibacterium jensenii]